MWLPETEWPCSDHVVPDVILKDDLETKAVLATVLSLAATTASVLPNPDRFSRWTVAVRAVATMRRWLTSRRDGELGEFSVEELTEAEHLWMK